MATRKTLTTAWVVKAKPAATRQEISDAGAAGLRLVVHTTGHKSWIMRFRRLDGRQGNLTLGPLDTTGQEDAATPAIGHPLTLKGARFLAGQVNRERAMGVDVIAAGRGERMARRLNADGRGVTTFPTAAQNFATEHLVAKTGLRPRRWIKDARLLGLDFTKDESEPTLVKGGIADRWRDRPVASITGDEIYGLVNECRRHGIPGMAKKGRALSDARGRHMAQALSGMFKWLHAHRRITANPCTGMYKPGAGPSRKRVLDFEFGTVDPEIKLFWQGCEALGDPFGPMLKLLLLTGCRLNEIARLENRELENNQGLIRLPGSRTKNHLPHDVPLSPLALVTLAGVRRVPNCKYVFSTTGKTPVSGFSKTKARLDKLMDIDGLPPISPWTFHDLRRTASTGMSGMCSVLPHIVEACLNHISGARASVAGVYNQEAYADEKRIAFEKWSDYVRWVVS
jgi:integrase